jgi:8-oxo-dGTP pyrophosphatase MutT (NUDIX family)
MITAQVVLINKQGLVLGVSRKTDHNDFGLPGGKMEDIDNENPMLTAIRETYEETGLQISNLRLVFAIHKSKNMGYTYLADYEGEINHNEPHIVKWLPFERLVRGSFGRYNELVSESLDSMEIKYQFDTDLTPIINEVREYVNTTPYDGHQYKFKVLHKDDSHCTVDFQGKYEELDECLGLDDDFDKGLEIIGKKYGFSIYVNSDYIGK